jgi:hypothetical protein
VVVAACMLCDGCFNAMIRSRAADIAACDEGSKGMVMWSGTMLVYLQ